MCWSSTHGGLLAALPEVGLLGMGCWWYVQGASDSLPHSFPGHEVVASVFGIAVQALLQATSLLAWMSPRCRVGFCPSLPFKDCNSVLKVLVLKCRGLTFS